MSILFDTPLSTHQKESVPSAPLRFFGLVVGSNVFVSSWAGLFFFASGWTWLTQRQLAPTKPSVASRQKAF